METLSEVEAAIGNPQMTSAEKPALEVSQNDLHAMAYTDALTGLGHANRLRDKVRQLAAERAEHVLEARERALVDAGLTAEHGHERVGVVGDVDLETAIACAPAFPTAPP